LKIVDQREPSRGIYDIKVGQIYDVTFKPNNRSFLAVIILDVNDYKMINLDNMSMWDAYGSLDDYHNKHTFIEIDTTLIVRDEVIEHQRMIKKFENEKIENL